MTWHSLSFMPNNMSCLCSIRSEIRGFSGAHKLAAEPKISSGCCKRVARILSSKMWSHLEPSHSSYKLCHVKACTCTALAPWPQPAASPSVHTTSMAPQGLCLSPTDNTPTASWSFLPLQTPPQSKARLLQVVQKVPPINTLLNTNLSGKNPKGQCAVKTEASNAVNNRKTYFLPSSQPLHLKAIAEL